MRMQTFYDTYTREEQDFEMNEVAFTVVCPEST